MPETGEHSGRCHSQTMEQVELRKIRKKDACHCRKQHQSADSHLCFCYLSQFVAFNTLTSCLKHLTAPLGVTTSGLKRSRVNH